MEKLIDANALKTRISKFQDNFIANTAAHEMLNDVLNIIDEAAPVDTSKQDQQWVSVKDKLPEKDDIEPEDYKFDRFIRCEVCVLTWDTCAFGIYPDLEPDYKERRYVDTALYDTEQKIFEIGAEKFQLNALIDWELMGTISGMAVTHWRPMPQPPENQE